MRYEIVVRIGSNRHQYVMGESRTLEEAQLAVRLFLDKGYDASYRAILP